MILAEIKGTNISLPLSSLEFKYTRIVYQQNYFGKLDFFYLKIFKYFTKNHKFRLQQK